MIKTFQKVKNIVKKLIHSEKASNSEHGSIVISIIFCFKLCENRLKT